MKIEVIKKPAVFPPVTIEITFESPDDLREMYHRTAPPILQMQQYARPGFEYDFLEASVGEERAYRLWSLIDDLLRERGIKP